MPVPSYGFDPTEVAIPWKVLTEQDIEVEFATPTGDKAAADRLMLSGERLGVWRSALRARQDAVDAYVEMAAAPSFGKPHKYADVAAADFDGIFLPGGHERGVREYLESEVLQQLVADFFVAKKPVAAICHGVVLAARSKSPDTGKSVLHNYKTTALLKSQELLAFNMTRLWLRDYYLTYPGMTVEDEVMEALSDKRNFISGPKPLFRDSLRHLQRGFTVRDGHYVSARWPGDAYSISLAFIEMLLEKDQDSTT